MKCYSKLQTLSRITRDYGVQGALLHTANSLELSRVRRFYTQKICSFDDSNFCIEMTEVDPEEVKYDQDFPFKVRDPEPVIGMGGGKWDKMRIKFNEKPLHRTLKMRFKEGKDWEKTPMYQKAEKRIKQDKKSWNSSKTIKELENRCNRLDQLYQDMKENGYQREKVGTTPLAGSQMPDELRIAIGRNGELIRCAAGRHRLSIAKILDIKIPAIIQIKHKGFKEA